jgi:RNA polymerase sigma-70 factor (ECF subfamily)
MAGDPIVGVLPLPLTSAEDEADEWERPVDFDTLYREHRDFVSRAMHRLAVPYRDREDVAQEIFLRIHRLLPRWNPETPARVWIFGIAYNVVREHRRGLRRHGIFDPLPESLTDSTHDPAANAQHREEIRLLDRLLNELSQERRDVFVLVELLELTAPEVSEVLHLPVNSVYARLRAAREDFNAGLARHRRRMS